MTKDWAETAARRIHLLFALQRFSPQDTSIPNLAAIIRENCPYKPDMAYEPVNLPTPAHDVDAPATTDDAPIAE